LTSYLSDTKPELALHGLLVKHFSPTGHGITGCMNPIEVAGKKFSYDRRMVWYRNLFTNKNLEGKHDSGYVRRGCILFEVHADHKWVNSEKKDEVKRVLLLRSHNLIDIFLDDKRIKKYEMEIMDVISVAIDKVNRGEKTYYAIYEDNGEFLVSCKVNEY